MALDVIGAGLGRTGTGSLKYALEMLLGSPCYHMTELLGRAGHVDLWLEAAAGKPKWETIFDGYGATVDFPAANYWRELVDVYPDAKVILSVRDADRWFQSTQDTIFSQTIAALQVGTKWGKMVKATIGDHLGGDTFNRTRLIDAYEAHNRAVEEALDAERLLVFDAKQGWAPLCKFLEVDVPDEPFPHVNSKEEFDNVFNLLRSPLGRKAMNGEGMGERARVHEDVFPR